MIALSLLAIFHILKMGILYIRVAKIQRFALLFSPYFLLIGSFLDKSLKKTIAQVEDHNDKEKS